MVIITKYDKKDFDELLNHYCIGRYKSHKHIEFALENTVYIFSTTKGKYVLKIFEFHKMEEIKYQIRVEEYLYSKKVKIPYIVLSKSGESVLVFKKKRVCITKFVKGKHVKKLNNELTKNLGKSIGKMHNVLLKSKIKDKKKVDLIDKVMLKYRKVFKAPKGFMLAECNELLKEIKTIKCSKLRKCIIHADLHYINYLVEKSKVKAFLDWGDVHRNYLSYDLAVFFAHMMLGRKGLKKEKIKLFMKEYEKQINLNAEEKKSLLPFIKFRLIGVLFWHKMQIRKHKDQKEHLEKAIKYYIQKYKQIDKVSLKEFSNL